MSCFLRNLSIRHKLAAGIIITILFTMALVLPVASYIIHQNLSRQQQEHLRSVKNLVSSMLSDYMARVMDYSILFSNDRELKDSLFYHIELSGEREHPLRAADHLYQAFGLDSVEVGNSVGRVVAAAEDHLRYNIDRLSDGLIRSALTGRPASGFALVPEGILTKASAPIYHDKRLIGTVTTGILLNDDRLRSMQHFSNTHIVVTDTAWRPITATSHNIIKSIQDIRHPEPDYVTTSLPLSDEADRLIGNVVILYENRLPAVLFKAHLVLFVSLSLIAVFLIYALLLLAKRFIRPLTVLQEGVERIGRGEFGYRIEVGSHDEIGKLSEGFNRMARNLEHLCAVEMRLAQSEKLAAIGRFAAGVAHEINNPIGNILGIAKLMQKTSPEAVKQELEMIVQDARRCAKIVSDLLIYSRQSPPRKEKVQVSMLINDAVAAVSRETDRDRIDLTAAVSRDIPDIFVDPIQIGQVIRNVLLNAIQSIDGKGSVRIEAGATNDGMMEIVVIDTGSGMDEEVLQKIFFPFFTTKPAGQGTGLGLAISYGIVRNHGGEINVESKKGKGSIFRIRLPIGDVDGQADKDNGD